ncbi:MAG: 30S ribosomal protein S6 [Kiritimatiellia bacterium]|nr:30S ribosomal protein S6 [Kiritimatiellia bacterium]
MKKYEALFILSNTISDEQLETKIEQIRSEITKLGGTVQSATRMGRINFARPIAKKETGLYVQTVFLIEPAQITALHECYRHNEDLIRIQITSARLSASNAMPTRNAAHNAAGGHSIADRPVGVHPEASEREQIPAAAKKDKPAFVPSTRSPGNTAKQTTT